MVINFFFFFLVPLEWACLGILLYVCIHVPTYPFLYLMKLNGCTVKVSKASKKENPNPIQSYSIALNPSIHRLATKTALVTYLRETKRK